MAIIIRKCHDFTRRSPPATIVRSPEAGYGSLNNCYREGNRSRELVKQFRRVESDEPLSTTINSQGAEVRRALMWTSI